MQQERKKEDLEKRENNPVLFNTPESGKPNAQKRQNEGEVKFKFFCINSLQLLVDRLPEVDKLSGWEDPAPTRMFNHGQ